MHINYTTPGRVKDLSAPRYKEGGTMFFRKVGKVASDYIVSQPQK